MHPTVGLLSTLSPDDASAIVWGLRSAGISCRAVALRSVEPAAVKAALSALEQDLAIVIVSDAVPRMRDLEYAIAMLGSDATDVLVGVYDQTIDEEGHISIRKAGGMMRRALSFATGGAVARMPCGIVIGETTSLQMILAEIQSGTEAWGLELGWLARRYGVRADEFPMSLRIRTATVPRARFLWTIGRGLRFRRNASRGSYRRPRRCPICFSIDVRTRDQMDGNVLRECRRCKCRYLSRVPTVEAIEKTRLLRLDRAREREEAIERADKARHRTIGSRAERIARLLPPRSRILEVGARSGELGLLLRERFEYCGIEIDAGSARAAREHGLEVYRAGLTDFVSLSGAYDAVVMYDVIENLPNTHDAVSKVKELVRPGGYLILTTPDTESLTALVCGSRWSAHKVPEHIVLYSRSALVELLENAGFHIVTAVSDYRHFDHQRLRQALGRWPATVRRAVSAVLHLLPDPFAASSGCIRIVAQRSSGPPVGLRPVPSVEMSRAR